MHSRIYITPSESKVKKFKAEEPVYTHTVKLLRTGEILYAVSAEDARIIAFQCEGDIPSIRPI